MSSKREAQTLKSEGDSKPTCFVLMPISDPDGYDKGHFKRVYEDIFVPACDKAGHSAIRADEVRQANLIHLDILQKLIDSPMALCDLSSRNPNALFELGLRQAFDKPVVLVQEMGTPPIFDIAPLRYVEYHRALGYRDVIEAQESIAKAMVATKEAFDKTEGVNSIVKLLSLTQPAALPKIKESDKDQALLQLMRAELSALRVEFRDTINRLSVEPDERTVPIVYTTQQIDKFISNYLAQRNFDVPITTVRAIRKHILTKNKINAIKTYREVTGEGLLESKHAIEDIMVQLGFE